MKTKSLHRTLIKNYVVFVLIIVLICIVSLLFLVFTVGNNMSKQQLPRISAAQLARADYTAADISDLKVVGGWVEVLDSQNKVVFTKGKKLTKDMVYAPGQLYEMLSYDGTNGGYVCTAKAFKGNDGSMYTFLSLMPADKVTLQLNLINSPFPVARALVWLLVISGLFFLVLFLLNIYLYSKWTAGRISTPLTRITQALSEMGSGNLGARMGFEAEYEFLEIRDAFNLLADRLEKAEREKTKLEEGRSRMFVDISHDLKTPITTIAGYCRALSEGLVKDEAQRQRYLRTVCDKSVRVASLIDDLFELSKLEAGGIRLSTEAVDLAELLRGLAAEHYEQLEEKGLSLDFHVPEEEVLCMVDRKQMGRVLTNILANAIRYNTAGTTVRVELFETGGSAIVEIADNGTGISEELKAVIFEPFARGDAARSSDGGSGLGLAIAKGITEAHGGVLELLTDRGSDRTIFRLTLPLQPLLKT